MPKIPLINSQRSMPSLPSAVVNDRSGQIIGAAVNDLGDSLRIAEEKSSEKKAKVQAFEAENRLMDFSRQQYTDALDNRNGKLALPDEKAGYKGVYGEYDKAADEFVSKQITSIDPRYQDFAKERLTNVADRYRDKFMVHQATQQSAYRAEVLGDNIKLMEDELKTSMAAGYYNAEDVEFVYKDIEAMTKAEGNGKDNSQFLEGKKAALYEGAILAASTNFPEKAKEILDDNRAIKALDATTRARLEKVVEGDLINKAVDENVNYIVNSGLDREDQQKLVQDMETKTPQQREIQAKVATQVEVKNNSEDRLRNTQEKELVMDVSTEIYDGKVPDIADIYHGNGRYAVLDQPSKDYLVNSIKQAAGGGLTKTDIKQARDLYSEGDAVARVYRGALDKDGVYAEMDKYIKTDGKEGLSPTVARTTLTEIEEMLKAPQLGSAATDLQNKYDFGKKDQATFHRTMVNEIRSFRARNERNPSYEEILTIGDKIASPLVEGKWWNPFDGTARFKDKAFDSLGAEEDAVMSPIIKAKLGWDIAEYDEPSGMWYGRKGDKVFRFDQKTRTLEAFTPAEDGL